MAKDKDHPCRFGASRLRVRIRNFGAEIDGVRKGAGRTLPAKHRERVIITPVARCHRKPVSRQPGRLFAGLHKRDRKRVLVPASFLRIADGPDYTYGNRVVPFACAIAPEEVSCAVTFDGDGSVDRARAPAKADLFERVFQRRVVIS